MRPTTGLHRRRRVLVAVLTVLGLSLTLTGCRAVIEWLGEDGAGASVVETPRPEAVPTEVCPTTDELYGPATEPVPPALAAEIEEHLGHSLLAGQEVSMSVWVDGWGEVVAHNPDLALKPASNQKILTAIGALGLLDHEQRFVTALRATAPVADGRIDGDLVLVGGGDPVLRDVGEHSIYRLAADLRDLGVTEVTGGLHVDESRYDQRRIAQGWTDQQIPGDATPISALTVEANQLGDSYEYLADPASGNARVFLRYLDEVGVRVVGGLIAEPPPAGSDELVRLESPTVRELVGTMLKSSDNTTAELLLKEIGVQAGGEGSTLDGLTATRAVVEGWCVDLAGTDDDGSGLSYQNTRSAREWRQTLQVAQQQEWWPVLHDSLPVAGEGGTLGSRFDEEPTAGNLRAKTGTIEVARALTGVFTTVDGRPATFSVIVNGADPTSATGPTDQILEAVAAQPG